MNNEKQNRLNDILAEVFEVEKGSISYETRFVEDLNANSMKRVVIAAELEELSGISFTPAKIKFMKTVSELYAALRDWLE